MYWILSTHGPVFRWMVVMHDNMTLLIFVERKLSLLLGPFKVRRNESIYLIASGASFLITTPSKLLLVQEATY
jgi:hypothetical protein